MADGADGRWPREQVLVAAEELGPPLAHLVETTLLIGRECRADLGVHGVLDAQQGLTALVEHAPSLAVPLWPMALDDATHPFALVGAEIEFPRERFETPLIACFAAVF